MKFRCIILIIFAFHCLIAYSGNLDNAMEESKSHKLVYFSDNVDLFKSPWKAGVYGTLIYPMTILERFPQYSNWEISVSLGDGERRSIRYKHQNDEILGEIYGLGDDTDMVLVTDVHLGTLGTCLNEYLYIGMSWSDIQEFQFLHCATDNSYDLIKGWEYNFTMYIKLENEKVDNRELYPTDFNSMQLIFKKGILTKISFGEFNCLDFLD
ncbi:MAG: hypothetical protein K2O00_05290 [Muribaculaceae bacterium]|nr:hypothetical protein [Muribaculaceae bacterium]